MTHSEFVHNTFDEKWCVEFLIQNKIFESSIDCPKCGNKIILNRESLTFRCHKRINVAKNKRKRKSQNCNYYQSVKTGTWFQFSNLPLSTVCKFIAHFLWIPVPRYTYISEDLLLSSRTVVDWSSFCRELCVYWCENYSEKIGGPDKIVEIDEAKFGKRKYNRGRLIKGKWVFGGYERGSKKIFIMPVEDRTADTLLTCIQQWILPGTKIMSDKWKAYDCLTNAGFNHLTVNHSINFVDPDTGAHTQSIERTWREVRSNISKYGTRESHLISYLAEYMFKRAHPLQERIYEFFKIMKEFQKDMIADKIFNENADGGAPD